MFTKSTCYSTESVSWELESKMNTIFMSECLVLSFVCLECQFINSKACMSADLKEFVILWLYIIDTLINMEGFGVDVSKKFTKWLEFGNIVAYMVMSICSLVVEDCAQDVFIIVLNINLGYLVWTWMFS